MLGLSSTDRSQCCRCCAMLLELLQEWRMQQPTPGQYPDLVLPGTHSSIFPWIPPTIGIPPEVLKRMREKLIGVLQDVVRTAGGVEESTQTSPALSVAELPRGYPDMSKIKSYASDTLGRK